MATVLLDTTVASFLHPRKKGTAERLRYEPHLAGNTLALSFQSVAELFFWSEENRWGVEQRLALDGFLRRFLVVPYDVDLSRTWARVMSHAKSVGRRLEAGDGWIAATAVHRGIPLLSHDRDFVHLALSGLEVICYAGPEGE